MRGLTCIYMSLCAFAALARGGPTRHYNHLELRQNPGTDTAPTDKELRQAGFRDFQWITQYMDRNDKLAQCSGPYNRREDWERDPTSTRKLTSRSLAMLQRLGIVHVISLNTDDDPSVESSLASIGVTYTAMPVDYFEAPSLDNLRQTWDIFRAHSQGTLVWSGTTKGRSGTVVSALQMYAEAGREHTLFSQSFFQGNGIDQHPQDDVLIDLHGELHLPRPEDNDDFYDSGLPDTNMFVDFSGDEPEDELETDKEEKDKDKEDEKPPKKPHGYENEPLDEPEEFAGFHRFEAVTEHMDTGDGLFRSSAPNYNDADEDQDLTPAALKFLADRGIVHVISLNSKADNETIRKLLENNGIAYTSLPTQDYAAPTLDDLRRAWNAFSNFRQATLVWCGYGHGRTGTVITALQMFAQDERHRRQDRWVPHPFTHNSYIQNHVESPEQEAVLDQLQHSLGLGSPNPGTESPPTQEQPVIEAPPTSLVDVAPEPTVVVTHDMEQSLLDGNFDGLPCPAILASLSFSFINKPRL